MVNVLEDMKFIIGNSDFVNINKDKLDEFCKDVNIKNFKYWFEMETFNLSKLNDEEKLNLLFIFDSINFSYWGSPKWSVNYKGQMLGGAFSMIASLLRAIENKIPLLDMNYLTNLSENDFAMITRANTEIPLFKERLDILKENAFILKNKFNGQLSNLIKEANKDALRFVELIIENFPSFNDSCEFKGRKVYFLKRAQLLVFEIYEIFKGEGYGEFKNMEKITGFADYKIPNELRLLGILDYNKQLSQKIDQKIELKKGSQEECEIRANMIWSVNLITKKLQDRFPKLLQTYVNDYLWSLGQKKWNNLKPYHLVRTTNY